MHMYNILSIGRAGVCCDALYYLHLGALGGTLSSLNTIRHHLKVSNTKKMR